MNDDREGEEGERGESKRGKRREREEDELKVKCMDCHQDLTLTPYFMTVFEHFFQEIIKWEKHFFFFFRLQSSLVDEQWPRSPFCCSIYGRLLTIN